jgi:hypothetical protein
VFSPHPNKQINNTTQDNKRQTQPHPNKQINNITQDNKRQTPQHPKKQIKQRNSLGVVVSGVYCLVL